MESATEQLLQDVAHVTNTADKRGRVIKRATNYLKTREIEGVNQELKGIEAQLAPTNIGRQAISADGLKHLSERRSFLQDKLEDHSAPELTGEAKDALNTRLNDLNARIRVGMPTHEDMRRNPAGAVDQHRRWEKLNKSAVLERRNILIALNPGDDSKDLTNIDMIRPHAPNVGAATFMPDAQIPGVFAMTPAAKENWPLGEPKVDTPLKQAERAEVKGKRPRSAAQLANDVKMAERAQAKRDAKAAQVKSSE